MKNLNAMVVVALLSTNFAIGGEAPLSSADCARINASGSAANWLFESGSCYDLRQFCRSSSIKGNVGAQMVGLGSRDLAAPEGDKGARYCSRPQYSNPQGAGVENNAIFLLP